MACLKKYAYAPFILLLQSVAALASPDMWSDNNKQDYLSKPKVKPKLSWESRESKTDRKVYCLTPSDPSCSNMWQKEKQQEDNGQAQRYQEKKLRKNSR